VAEKVVPAKPPPANAVRRKPVASKPAAPWPVPTNAAVVSLLTDYGSEDGFVGALHSVLRRALPQVPIVDLTHAIARQNVRAGSLALVRATPYLAPGVVLAVVDPGVGTSRRGVAVEPASGPGVVFVGPDNGLLPPAVDALGGVGGCVELEDRGYWLATPGPTFAGRDIFAPAAAQLAGGAALEDLGKPVPPEGLVRLPPPFVALAEDGSCETEVTWVDRFGNVQLAAAPSDIWGTSAAADPCQAGGPSQSAAVEVKGAHGRYEARRARVFADLAPRQLGLLVDSYGHLALVLNGASAADVLGTKEGEVVVLRARYEP
jgi:S-adenosylmethionine hydrolase